MTGIKKFLSETIRCARHNLLHLKMFRVRYRGGRWHVTDREGLHLVFDFYPYLMFYEIEGYLRQGKWRLDEGMVVIDGGGCFGEFSYYAALRVGKSGRVLMFEPDPANIKQAEDLFAKLGGKPLNLVIVPAGLWKSAGTLRFAAGLGEGSVLLGENEAPPAGAIVAEVPVESLDSVATSFNLRRMDLVKLDIEGAEVEVVESAGPVIRKLQPRFSIASYHRRDEKLTAELIEPLFRKFGYQAATGFPSHQTTWAGPTL